jgi:pimeloyl-ACP methyl ester carboxylesterase
MATGEKQACQVPHLVLMPGLDGTGLLFQPFLRAMERAQAYTVVTYPPAKVLSMPELVQIAAAQIPSDRPVVLVAESFSGPIAAELLRTAAPIVRGAVFVAAMLGPPRPLLLRLARLLPAGTMMRAPIPGRLLRRYCLGAEAPDETLRLLRQAIRSVEPRVLAGRIRMLGELRPPAGQARVPACYIQPTGDRLVPPGCLAAFQSFLPNLAVARIAGPHMVMQAHPRDCWRIIQDSVRICSRPSEASTGEPR